MTQGLHSRVTDSQKWFVFAATLAGAGLLYLLAPVLTPFLVSAVLAYLGDPVVDRLEARRIPRTLGVVIVFAVLVMVCALVTLLLVPLLADQVDAFIKNWPSYVQWIQNTVTPRVAMVLGVDPGTLKIDQITQALSAHWQQAGGVASTVLASVSKSGLALFGWLANLLLVPVVTFYLLRDWDILVERIRELLPRRVEPHAARLAGEVDSVLGAFLRGQLSVMAALASVYSIGLWIVGIDLAFLIGLLAGLVSFVPYLGFLVGVTAASIAAYLQFQELFPLLWVLMVFGVGQALEGMVLTPLLVGDKIGLHPVAVIFAVMTGAQLFGFVGILIALPVAAVLVVMLREVRRQYVNSTLYSHGHRFSEGEALVADVTDAPARVDQAGHAGESGSRQNAAPDRRP